MKRAILQGVCVVQMGVVMATVFEWQYLFVPAALGLALLACAVPEEKR
jgi:hypothetical protein